MTVTDEPRQKVHDPEETPAEQARRLITARVETLNQANKGLRERLWRHARKLSKQDRDDLYRHLQREADMVLRAVEDSGEELPPFRFTSDLVDTSWS